MRLLLDEASNFRCLFDRRTFRGKCMEHAKLVHNEIEHLQGWRASHLKIDYMPWKSGSIYRKPPPIGTSVGKDDPRLQHAALIAAAINCIARERIYPAPCWIKGVQRKRMVGPPFAVHVGIGKKWTVIGAIPIVRHRLFRWIGPRATFTIHKKIRGKW